MARHPHEARCLDASVWKIPEDFYSALLPELGAPDWHGRNLDALSDSLSGSINRLEPPFCVEIVGLGHQPKDMKTLLGNVAAVFKNAQAEHGADVSFKAN
ncbi:barstar family protein [Altererythrobacter aquiaggeris]|uniref:barstar family protein n=1 Tax=Aestuarierythrobacter aquiaggeris TaxID=1898396 RepID=UPI0030160E90